MLVCVKERGDEEEKQRCQAKEGKSQGINTFQLQGESTGPNR